MILSNAAFYGNVPNVVVEWLTLLRIQEVPGSNLGQETGSPKIFRDFPESQKQILGSPLPLPCMYFSINPLKPNFLGGRKSIILLEGSQATPARTSFW
jgi:hypothetical protein